MSDKSKIEWCDATWNPIVGCSKVSAGCKHCYAERMACRLAAMGQEQYIEVIDPDAAAWEGNTVFVEKALSIPLKWKKPKVIFPCSMGDLFHESVPFEWIDKAFSVMALCPQHVFICPTKRAERMKEYVGNTESHRNDARGEALHSIDKNAFTDGIQWPLPNVILGVSVENQEAADERLSYLYSLAAMGWKTMVSMEPMLSEIRIPQSAIRNLNWVILGGESGPGARPMNPDWARKVRDQCTEAGVPFFYKQGPDENGKLVSMPKLDGVVHDGRPEMVRKIIAAREAGGAE